MYRNFIDLEHLLNLFEHKTSLFFFFSNLFCFVSIHGFVKSVRTCLLLGKSSGSKGCGTKWQRLSSQWRLEGNGKFRRLSWCHLSCFRTTGKVMLFPFAPHFFVTPSPHACVTFELGQPSLPLAHHLWLSLHTASWDLTQFWIKLPTDCAYRILKVTAGKSYLFRVISHVTLITNGSSFHAPSRPTTDSIRLAQFLIRVTPSRGGLNFVYISQRAQVYKYFTFLKTKFEGKQLKRFSIGEWSSKHWYIHGMEYCSAVKRNKLLTHVTSWIDLRVSCWVKNTQSQKVTRYIIPFIQHFQKWRKNKDGHLIRGQGSESVTIKKEHEWGVSVCWWNCSASFLNHHALLQFFFLWWKLKIYSQQISNVQ